MLRPEFLHMAKDMKPLLDPRFAFRGELAGESVGFMLALPDYNEVLRHNRSGRLFPLGGPLLLWRRWRIRNRRVMALGVKSSARSRSILALFRHEIMRRGQLYGKNGALASWLLEDNGVILKPMRAMGASGKDAVAGVRGRGIDTRSAMHPVIGSVPSSCCVQGVNPSLSGVLARGEQGPA